MFRLFAVFWNLLAYFRFWELSPTPALKEDPREKFNRWTDQLPSPIQQEEYIGARTPLELVRSLPTVPHLVDGFPFTILPEEGDEPTLILFKYLILLWIFRDVFRLLALSILFCVLSVNAIVLFLCRLLQNLCIVLWYELGGWLSWRTYRWETKD